MRRGNEDGFVKIFFLICLFVAVLFVIISFAGPYYRFNTLRSHTKDYLMAEIGNVETTKQKVKENAAELHIPLEDNNIIVTQEKKITRVKATWSETVDFWGYYQKKLDFDMEVEY